MAIKSGSDWITKTAVAAVAGVAAVVSYLHMQTVAAAAGEQWRAWLLPLSVDGLVISASLAAFRAKRANLPIHGMTKLSLVIGLVVSIAANVLVPFLRNLDTQQRSWLSAVVAAWPAVALALAFEEFLRLRHTASAEAETPETETAPSSSAAETLPSVPVPGVSANPVALPVSSRKPSAPVHDGSAPKHGGGADSSAKTEAMAVARAEPGITGKQLGTRFGRSDSWGRSIIRAARRDPTP